MAREPLTPYFLPDPAIGSAGGMTIPLTNRFPRIGTPCPKPREGGMCGCDEPDYAPPAPCLSSECDC